MRALLRLALWGSTAVAALVLAVVAASSNTGSQRLLAALQGRGVFSGTPQVAQAHETPPQPSTAQLAARAAEAEEERQRLTETVRSLSADRDRLQARMASLEHALQDVTGSIRQQPPATPPSNEQPAMTAAPAPAAAPTTVAKPAALAPEPAAPAPETVPAAASHIASQEVPEQTEAKPQVGVDIGGAVNFEGLRALWKSVSGSHPTLLEDMHPLVLVRETGRSRSVELRLIAGPVADAEAAAKLCEALTAARRYCYPAEFEGQKLSLAAAELERRPAAGASERRSSPSPAHRQPPRRSP